MTTVQVVETSVTVNNNSPIQEYVHPDDQTQTTFEIKDYIDIRKFCPFIINVLENIANNQTGDFFLTLF